MPLFLQKKTDRFIFVKILNKMPVSTIHKREEINARLKEAFHKIESFILETKLPVLQKKTDRSWSIIEHFEHLVLSAAPIAKSLGLPREYFWKFGKLDRSVLDYSSLFDRYKKVLAGGVKAPPHFDPRSLEQAPPTPLIEKKKALLLQWDRHLATV